MNNQLIGHPILKNYPKDISTIEWKFLDKESYLEMEKIFTDGVTFFDPFIVDNFYPQDMFDELVEICNKNNLNNLDYSKQMNKWEQSLDIPEKFKEYAVNKVKELINTDDVYFKYLMYAHHQITTDGRNPKLPLHIDRAPGAYMVDLHLGGNRDWPFVARYSTFTCKPNQAIICQPQFDYHYRPSWNSDNPEEYYQAIFFHLVNKNNWSRESKLSDRSKDINDKYEFGNNFRDTKIFEDFQNQRQFIFDDLYVKTNRDFECPRIPWDEIPEKNEEDVHSLKGVMPKNQKEIR
jgi:hypothetical protein